jgi:hypothetical protein
VSKIACALCAILLSAHVHAANVELAKLNMADEYATCSVLYMLGAEEARRQGNLQLAQRTEVTVDALLRTAVRFSNSEFATSRAKRSLKRMRDEMKAGFPVLVSRYYQNCQQALDDPAARLEYWLAK